MRAETSLAEKTDTTNNPGRKVSNLEFLAFGLGVLLPSATVMWVATFKTYDYVQPIIRQTSASAALALITGTSAFTALLVGSLYAINYFQNRQVAHG